MESHGPGQQHPQKWSMIRTRPTSHVTVASKCFNLKESMGRSSAPAASLSKAVALSSAPSEEQLAGVSHGIGDALGSDWPGRKPRATDSLGQYLKGESWVSGWPGHPKLREMGFLRGEPLSAVPKGLGTGSELSYQYSELCQLPSAYTHYEVLPEDKTRYVPLDRLVYIPCFQRKQKKMRKLSQVLQMVCRQSWGHWLCSLSD